MKTNNLHLRNYLLDECHAMVKFLSAEGRNIPDESQKLLNKHNDESLWKSEDIIHLHKVLSHAVLPARPKTIWLLYNEENKKSFFSFLGPVGLVRKLMLVAIVSLIIFITISLSPKVNAQSVAMGILAGHGTELLLNLSFFLSAAALGACFSNLFEANKYIVQTIFDPKYESSYWIRFVLGLIAGLMLAVLIPITPSQETSSLKISFISFPLLAMLGGFSASLVYRILRRIVNTVESFITGHPDKDKKLQEKDQLEKQQQRLAIERKEMLDVLMNLKSESHETKIKEKLTNTIDKILMN